MGKKMEALRTSNYICNQNIKGQKVLGDEDGGKKQGPLHEEQGT